MGLELNSKIKSHLLYKLSLTEEVLHSNPGCHSRVHLLISCRIKLWRHQLGKYWLSKFTYFSIHFKYVPSRHSYKYLLSVTEAAMWTENPGQMEPNLQTQGSSMLVEIMFMKLPKSRPSPAYLPHLDPNLDPAQPISHLQLDLRKNHEAFLSLGLYFSSVKWG